MKLAMSERKIKVSFIVQTDSTKHFTERLQAAFGDEVVVRHHSRPGADGDLLH